MTLFIILLVFFAALHVPSIFGLDLTFLKSSRDKARIAVGSMFIFSGSSHFWATETFLKMMPEILPAHLAIVYVSGLLEIAGGIGLFIPKLQRWAAIGLVVLLVGVLPANINVALNNIQLGGWMNDPLYQWIRVPFQLILIWWVIWSNQLWPFATNSLQKSTVSYQNS